MKSTSIRELTFISFPVPLSQHRFPFEDRDKGERGEETGNRKQGTRNKEQGTRNWLEVNPALNHLPTS